MIRNDEVRHLVDHDVFKTLLRIMDQIGRHRDPVFSGIADTPSGSHDPAFELRDFHISVIPQKRKMFVQIVLCQLQDFLIKDFIEILYRIFTFILIRQKDRPVHDRDIAFSDLFYQLVWLIKDIENIPAPVKIADAFVIDHTVICLIDPVSLAFNELIDCIIRHPQRSTGHDHIVFQSEIKVLYSFVFDLDLETDPFDFDHILYSIIEKDLKLMLE